MRCVENDDHEWHQVPPAVQELLIAKARRLSGWPAEGAALSLRKKNYLTLAKSYLERETGLEPATLCLGSRCSTAELLPPTIDYISLLRRACFDLGGLNSGDIVRMSALWFDRYGFDYLEVPRRVDACAAYAAKYLVKDISRGDVLFSKGLVQHADAVQRRLPGQRW